jgi:hypothetical protein
MCLGRLGERSRGAGKSRGADRGTENGIVEVTDEQAIVRLASGIHVSCISRSPESDIHAETCLSAMT